MYKKTIVENYNTTIPGGIIACTKQTTITLFGVVISVVSITYTEVNPN